MQCVSNLAISALAAVTFASAASAQTAGNLAGALLTSAKAAVTSALAGR